MRPRRGERIITDTTWLKRLTTLAAAAIGCAAPLMAAAYAGLPAAVAQQLKSAGIAPTAVAAFAQEVGSDRPILSYNADMPMNPASVMKLVTTFAALELLGPTYTWRTELLGRRAAGDVLEGDLFLRGSGDPKLTLEGFWALLRSLRARGIRAIRGDLVLDRARFESVEFDPAKFDNEPLRAYNVGPDAVLVNFKVVRFTFLPDGATGTVSVVAEPRLPQVDMVANVRATPGACGDWRAGLAADIQAGSASARLRFAGSIPASCGERTWFVSLLSPQQYTYGLFQSLWSEMGGRSQAAGGKARHPPTHACSHRPIRRRSSNWYATSTSSRTTSCRARSFSPSRLSSCASPDAPTGLPARCAPGCSRRTWTCRSW